MSNSKKIKGSIDLSNLNNGTTLTTLPYGATSTTNTNTSPYNYSNYNLNSSGGNYTYGNGVDYTTSMSYRLDSIILLDEKDGTEWKLKVIDGELVIQPLDKKNIRKLKIDKVLESK